VPTRQPTIAPSAVPTRQPTAVPTASRPPVGAEILFLRAGDLIAYSIASRAERRVAAGVRAFAATPDGRLLALVRGAGRAGEIWLVQRDGSAARQLTTNERAESDLSWAPDGLSLAYSSADSDTPHPLDWEGYSRWCAASQARLLDLADAVERSLGPGCEPAFAPDGKRLAFVTPPQDQPSQLGFRGANNSLRLVNRQGQNGWNFARADGKDTAQGYMVYAPAWAPGGAQLAYQRFIGYQALVDINITEIGASFQGKGRPLASGAGWMVAPHFSPDGRRVAVLEHNYSDARGGSGYEIWRLTMLRLGQPDTIFLPGGELPAVGRQEWQAARITAAAWSPDSASLAVALPAGWRADIAQGEMPFSGDGAGEIWRMAADGAPVERLVQQVDYTSPLLWLPAG
jgi:dipeptidyl aminopeptidase/acylaminoacyl peptidase